MTGCEGDGKRRRETGSQGDNADISFEMQDTEQGVSHLAGHSICKPIKPGQPPGIGAAEMVQINEKANHTSPDLEMDKISNLGTWNKEILGAFFIPSGQEDSHAYINRERERKINPTSH